MIFKLRPKPHSYASISDRPLIYKQGFRAWWQSIDDRRDHHHGLKWYEGLNLSLSLVWRSLKILWWFFRIVTGLAVVYAVYIFLSSPPNSFTLGDVVEIVVVYGIGWLVLTFLALISLIAWTSWAWSTVYVRTTFPDLYIVRDRLGFFKHRHVPLEDITRIEVGARGEWTQSPVWKRDWIQIRVWYDDDSKFHVIAENRFPKIQNNELRLKIERMIIEAQPPA